MSKLLKSFKIKIFAVALASVLAVSGLCSCFLFGKTNFDYPTAMLVKNRVTKAQYLPNLELLVDDTQSVQLTSATPDKEYYTTDLSFNLEDYKSIVDELAIITGTGIRHDSDILEIKKEIYTVLEMVPEFGSWFQLPYNAMPSQNSQDGYNNYYYKIDYDRNSEKITITRMTWRCVCEIYSFAEDKIYSTYYDDVHQYQIMQTNYYYNENNKEVVECSVVDFAKFNNEFYPIQCQYLENVENTSTTKIQSVIRKQIDAYDNSGNVDRGLDIDTYRAGGVLRKVVQLNYTDADNVELIKIEQNFGTDYLSDINTTNLAFYLKQNENAIYFTDAWDYYDAANSADEIPLRNMFDFYYTDSPSKEDIITSFIKSGYSPRQVMCTPNYGNSSRNVCNDCYYRNIASGLLVYKCNHNKSQDNIARAARQTVCSSSAFQNEVYQMLPWQISKLLSDFATSVGVSDEIVSSYSNKICCELGDQYLFENNLDIFLEKVSQSFIEEVSLTKSVKNLYNTIKENSKRLSAAKLNTSAISSEVALENINETTSVSDNVITVNATANVKPNILLEKNAKYSIGLVLYDSTNSIINILLTNYVAYTGKNLNLSLNGSYNLSGFKLQEKDVKAFKPVNLTLGYALLKGGAVYEVACSGFVNANVSSGTFNTFENAVNGFECTYAPSVENQTFKVSVSSVDVESPKIKLEVSEDNSVTFTSGSKVYSLLSLLEIYDNDAVQSVTVMHGTDKYVSPIEALKAGENTVTVVDRSGNEASLTFTIKLN